MKGVEWGTLYNQYKDVVYDTNKLELEILKLIDDDDVQSVKGIYNYVLTGKERLLNLRYAKTTTGENRGDKTESQSLPEQWINLKYI